MIGSISYPQQITPRVTILGNHFFSLYLIHSQPKVIIECGVRAIVPLVIDQIKGLGIELEEIGFIFLMHPHFDHATGVTIWKQEMPWLKVVGTPLCQEVLSRKKTISFFRDQDEAISEFLVSQGEIDFVPPLGERRIEIDHLLSPSANLDMGPGVTLQLIDAPGHSLGAIAVYLPEDEIIFTSDSLGFFLPPRDFFPLYFVDYRGYLETIQKLRDFRPKYIGIAHQGHLRQGEGDDFFALSREQAERLHQEIVYDLNRGELSSQVEEKLFRRFYNRELRIYTPDNIKGCCSLLVRRSAEVQGVIADNRGPTIHQDSRP
ncbi:MAG: hypothetical protein DRG50_00875 [Deltaproteobacteria bacterium]|nr:MAG: hypothetical protein DRG50_00875 [Deltaproteobacteria bacterium]